MSIPVFFPFTHISQTQKEVLSSVFDQLIFLPIEQQRDEPVEKIQTDRQWLRVLYGNKDQILGAMRGAEEYIEWAKIHQGSDIDLRILLKSHPYLSGTQRDEDNDDIDTRIKENSVPVLKSKILGQADPTHRQQIPQGDGTQNSKVSALEQALLFLRIAQITDAEKERIDQEFVKLSKTHQDLFTIMIPDQEAASVIPEETEHTEQGSDPIPQTADPGEHLTQKRVQSWLTYFFNGPFKETGAEYPVLVTTSKAVFEYLRSFVKKSTNTLDIDSIKVHENNCANKIRWQKQFVKVAESALSRGLEHSASIPSADDGCCLDVQINVCLLSKDDLDHVAQVDVEKMVICLVQLN